ncbi:hypothetical protein KY366_02425 [Candidatus Woesearchaeota archaeon]|nr:hypothetical protein [Candidatus Woesearchaeota archaeon]
MNKKGMFFTLMTTAFLIIFVFIFMVPGYRRFGERMVAIEMRVESMNDFIKDLKRDTSRGLYISSFRALMALEGHIIQEGEFLDDIEKSFREAVLNGTINNTNSTLMLFSTFPDWIENIQGKAEKFNIQANITLHDVYISQDDPWNIKVSGNLTFSIRDITNLASWDMNETINASISIIGFEDPLYIVYTYGRTTNLINKTPFLGNYTYVSGDGWNVSRLLKEVDESYYKPNTNAPDFLMRFENDLGASPNGIESLVNLKKLSDLGLEIDIGNSIVDYCYWDGVDGPYRVNFTPSWFMLDNAHRAGYNVTGLSYIP